MLVKHDKEIFSVVEVGPWLGLAPAEVSSIKKPCHHWKGSKIAMSLWQQILAFFEWSMQETKSETMVHLFYHEQHGWQAMVLPQEGHTGMTVKLLEDHPNRIPTFQRLGAGWDMMGTVHHHCASKAFQSGTDRDDEKTKEGIHITVGGITHKRYSIDTRATFRKNIMPIMLDEWFELDGVSLSVIPEELHHQALEIALIKPPAKDHPFPEWWKENVVKVVRPALVHTPNTHPAYSGSGMGYQSGGHMVQGQVNYRGNHQENYQGSYKPTWQKDRERSFKTSLLELLQGYQISVDEIIDYIGELDKDGCWGSLVKSLLTNEVSLSTGVSLAKEVREDLIAKHAGNTAAENISTKLLESDGKKNIITIEEGNELKSLLYDAIYKQDDVAVKKILEANLSKDVLRSLYKEMIETVNKKIGSKDSAEDLLLKNATEDYYASAKISV